MSARRRPPREPVVLRIPRLAGAEPGDAGYTTAIASAEMREAVRSARADGRITPDQARAELKELERAQRVALEEGRALVRFTSDPGQLITPRPRRSANPKAKRKAQREARRKNRPRKKKKR